MVQVKWSDIKLVVFVGEIIDLLEKKKSVILFQCFLIFSCDLKSM